MTGDPNRLPRSQCSRAWAGWRWGTQAEGRGGEGRGGEGRGGEGRGGEGRGGECQINHTSVAEGGGLLIEDEGACPQCAHKKGINSIGLHT